jgi:hypothetical protein
MIQDHEHMAALEDIARVRPAVQKLRSLFAAALAADSASMTTGHRRSPTTSESEPAALPRPPGR